jgi:hypothetical protein
MANEEHEGDKKADLRPLVITQNTNSIESIIGQETIRSILTDDLVRIITSTFADVTIRLLAGSATLKMASSGTLKVGAQATDTVINEIKAKLLTDPTLSNDAKKFLESPLGREILAFILRLLILVHLEHQADLRFHEVEQFVNQVLQSVGQLYIAHEIEAQPKPVPKQES